jgi:hypothetical protein
VNKVHQFEIYRFTHPTVVASKIPFPFLVPIAFSHCNVFAESADFQNQIFQNVYGIVALGPNGSVDHDKICVVLNVFLTFGQLLQNEKPPVTNSSCWKKKKNYLGTRKQTIFVDLPFDAIIYEQLFETLLPICHTIDRNS